MEMNELELKLLKHEAAQHLAKLRKMQGMVILSEAGKTFVEAEIAELSEQIATMGRELRMKKAQRLGWTRLRNLVRNLVFSIVRGRRSERKEATR